MKLAIAWVLFGVPLVAAFSAGIGLCRNWSTEHHRPTKVSAILLALIAPVLVCGTTAYVQFVKPLPAFDYRVEQWGILISLLGTILGLVTLRFPRWFSSVALVVSAWMLLLFFLMGLTY